MKAIMGLVLMLGAAALLCFDAGGAAALSGQSLPRTTESDPACPADRVLLGAPDGRPACVTHGTATKLMERGWSDPHHSGSGGHDGREVVTARTGPWTMDAGGERTMSGHIISRLPAPCYLPSSISVEVPSEAAVGRPFDVTITPSFEMTPEQIEDYNDLYDTGFESVRDMWESVCDSERASYYIIAPATYKPSGNGVSYLTQVTVYHHYPPYNYYMYHVDRKFDLGGDPTTIQMTIDEPIIFRVSDIDDRGNQDYFKFDFGVFEVDASTLPAGTLGPPRTIIHTDLNGDRIRLSDSEFASVRGTSAEPGPDDQLIPTTDGAGGSFMRPMRDGETTSLYDVPFWEIVEDPWGSFRNDAGPVATIERRGLGEEYLESFLNAYPEFKSSTRVSGAPVLYEN